MEEEAALFEHRFWLQILGDHARFIYNSLSPKEPSDIETANQFISLFDFLLQQSRLQAVAQISELNKQANQAVQKFRQFKLSLLERILLNKVMIGLSPIW